MFSKRHYKAIAEVIATNRLMANTDSNTERKELALAVVDCIEYDLADLFTQDNPLFNREKFIQTCK